MSLNFLEDRSVVGECSNTSGVQSAWEGLDPQLVDLEIYRVLGTLYIPKEEEEQEEH